MSLVSYDLKVMQRLSAFVLNRTTNDLRSELHDYLVMIALSEDAKKKGMAIAEIVSFIEKDLKVEKFPIPLIKSTIKRLTEKRSIEAVHGKGEDLYLLSQDKKNKIGLMAEQYSNTTVRVKEKLAKKISEIMGMKVDIVVENSAFVAFQNFLGTVLSNLGQECCFAIIGSRGKELSSLKPINVSEALDNVLSTMKNEDLQKAEKQAFLGYISNPNDDLSDYLFSLAQSYFIINVLHLDPECQSCTKESLQQKKAFMDTNVILHALTGKKMRNKSVNSALKLTSDLKVDIVFSKRTKQEFDNFLADARRTLGKEPKVPRNRYEKLHNELEDGLLKDFLEKKQKNPNLSLENYVERLEEIETILKNRFSASYDDTEYEEILKDPDLPQLKKIVVDEGVRFGLFKSDFVAEHDAFHILLIQELRKNDKGDILGPNYWFLTHDRSLFFVEKQFAKYEKFPSSIFLDNWVQLISPLLAPEQTKSAIDTYANLFASRLPVLTKTIDEDIFLAYQGKWMDDEDLTPQDVARVIGNRYVRDLYERSKEEEKQITEEERDMLVQPIIEEIKSQKKEREELKRNVSSLQQTTAQLRSQMGELEKTVTSQTTEIGDLKKSGISQATVITWLGHLFGAVMFLIVWYVFYQHILIHSLEPWQAFAGSIIIAAIFGYLADFHGYKWLVDKLLRYVSSR